MVCIFSDLTELSQAEEGRAKGARLFLSQMRALLTKRMLHSRRNLTLTVSQVLVRVNIANLKLCRKSHKPYATWCTDALKLRKCHF